MSYELIADAQVAVKRVEVHDDEFKTNHRHAEIIVKSPRGGEYIHRFPHTSRVSKALDLMKPEALQERLTGGSYFFVGNTLVDFRDGSYNGFVHSADNLDRLMDVIGYEWIDDFAENQKCLLHKLWNKYPFEIPEFQIAKDYHYELKFKWSPFVKTVNALLDLVRLICKNGMTVITSGLINTKIPLFNRWTEHLDIASKQIEVKMINLTQDRLLQMGSERATVAECSLVEKHAYVRLMDDDVNVASDKRQRLQYLIARVSPSINLGEHYQPGVFEDKNLSAQLPSHLTSLDLLNIATEIRTHTGQVAQSTTRAIDKLTNSLMFESHKDISRNVARFGRGVGLSSFSDPTRAFFGTVS